jgi:hypothetical protein
MRWIILCFLMTMPVCVGCNKSGAPDRAPKVDVADAIKREASVAKPGADPQEFVANQAGDKAQPEKKEPTKPRKIRYTADVKLVVNSIDDAEEKLDAIRKEHKAEYEKAEINRSANTVKSGMWKVRVPVDNQFAFRKAVAKLGQVERDTIDSEDITAKYYDLEAHITNRKLDREETRKFLVEIGKKDARYLEVKNQLDTMSDYINREEGKLKLWAELTDMSTYTIHMREKQSWEPKVVEDKETPPDFGTRVDTTWTRSWDRFVTFWQGVFIIAIVVAPWLPIALVVGVCFVLVARRVKRVWQPPVLVEVVDDANKKE